MPKIILDSTKRKLNRVSDYIRREMRTQGISQGEMAEALLISQQAYSAKLNGNRFTVEDLIRIFDKLDIKADKAAELLAG